MQRPRAAHALRLDQFLYTPGLSLALTELQLSLYFAFFCTTILTIGGWLNSVLLFISSRFVLYFIRTASSACLLKASLKTPVISIFTSISSSLCSVIWCLYRKLSFLFQFRLTLLTWMFHLHRPLLYSHLCKCFMSILHLYPILFVLHITSSLLSDLFLNNGHNMQHFLTFFSFKWVFFVQNIFFFYASLFHNFAKLSPSSR